MANDVSETADRPRSLEVAVEEIGPVELRQAIEAVDPVTAVWAAPDSPAVIAAGRESVVTGSGPDRFQQVKASGSRLLNRLQTDSVPEAVKPRLYGGFSFFDESTLAAPWETFEPAEFVLPSVQLVLEPDRTLIGGYGSGARPGAIDGIRSALETPQESKEEPARSGSATRGNELVEGGVEPAGLRADRADWIERVRTVRDRIEESDLEKAVLAAAFDLDIDGGLDLGATLTALAKRYPDCYRFAFRSPPGEVPNTSPGTFFGASPERLVKKQGRTAETEALAGTVERGSTDQADRASREHLQQDLTIRREHELVADRIREQLQTYGATVTAGDREVRTLANVHHLRTPLSATIAPEVHVLDLVELLHPTPALGGHPAEKARTLLAEVENIVRGWYGAPIGWFDADGDGTFAVGIRSALERDGQATLFAGNGIVAGSDPETEYRELEAKFDPIREVLG